MRHASTLPDRHRHSIPQRLRELSEELHREQPPRSIDYRGSPVALLGVAVKSGLGIQYTLNSVGRAWRL